MRIGFWKMFGGISLLLIGVYLINPFGLKSLDPRLRLLGISPYSVPSDSMAPTLKRGNYLISSAWRYTYEEPKRGDIVVFRHPKMADVIFVKRLIALPGERVALHDGQVLIDGKPLSEDYANKDLGNARPDSLEMPERLLGDDELFMLGDNRNNSNDSRYWGNVPRQNVIGRVISVF